MVSTRSDLPDAPVQPTPGELVEILERITDAFFSTDGAWRFTYVNREAEAFFGRTRAELLGREVWEVFPQVVESRFIAEYKRALASGEPVSFEAPSAVRAGSWLEVRAYPSASGLSVYFHDITERVTARQRVTFQAALLDAVGEMIVATAPDGTVTYWNRGAEKLLGRPPAEVIGRSIFDITPAEDQDPAPRAIHKRVMAGEEWTGEFQARSRYGERIPLLLNISPRVNGDGTVVGTVAVGSDLRPQKRAEDTLRFVAEAGAIFASSLDYETTLASVARLAVAGLADWCFIDVLEADGEIRRVATAHVNPRKEALARELMRYPPELDGPNVSSRILRTGEPWVRGNISEDDLASLSHHPEHLAVLRALEIRSGIGVPLVAHGRIVGAIRLGITESDRDFGEGDLPVVEELARHAALAIDNARLHREVQRGVSAREQLLRTVSHDLRNPLVAVFSHIELLLEQCDQLPAPESAKASLGMVLGAAQQMNRLIEDLLAVTSIETGRLAVAPRRVDLRDVVSEAADTLRPAATNHSLVLGVDVPGEPVMAGADRGRLLQVLANLIVNAIRFAPAGSQVSLRVAGAGDEARVCVTDQGPGVPPAERARIFDAFYTVPGSTLSRTGLGLYIAKGVVEAHRGRIWVEDAPGGGATFVFSLPLAGSDIR